MLKLARVQLAIVVAAYHAQYARVAGATGVWFNGRKSVRFVKKHALPMCIVACLCCTALIPVGYWAVGQMTRDTIVSNYLNMTVEEEWAQSNKATAQMVAECQRLGGAWSAGFASANCWVGGQVIYVHPDLSWYVVPIANPWYSWVDFGVVLGFVLSVVGAICGFVGIPYIRNAQALERMDKEREERNRRYLATCKC